MKIISQREMNEVSGGVVIATTPPILPIGFWVARKVQLPLPVPQPMLPLPVM
jgi:hypothetical protein